jgi:hypothetical protein
MSPLDLRRLTSEVKANCNISDARYWGNYSLCGLLLRYRELFRKEHGIKPWEHIEQGDIAEWISGREHLWNEISDDDYVNLTIGNREYSIYDIQTINQLLEEENIIYGAGIGIHGKPSFFLAELLSKEVKDGHIVYITGNEFSRDLSAYPAMLQGNTIFSRRDALSILLWDRFEEMKNCRRGGALHYAFSQYGILPEDQTSEDLYRNILRITENESEVYIYHEIGEAYEGKQLGSEWKRMLSEISDKKMELFVRSVKDTLADTSEKGLLRHIIQKEEKGSLGFYISFLGGFRKVLFPEIVGAFADFTETGNWQIIEQTRLAGYRRSAELASRVQTFLSNYTDKTTLCEALEKEFIDTVT